MRQWYKLHSPLSHSPGFDNSATFATSLLIVHIPHSVNLLLWNRFVWKFPRSVKINQKIASITCIFFFHNMCTSVFEFCNCLRKYDWKPLYSGVHMIKPDSECLKITDNLWIWNEKAGNWRSLAQTCILRKCGQNPACLYSNLH